MSKSPDIKGTDIAIVGWAQTPMVRRTELSETHLLVDVITDALEPLALTRADIDFTCLGSCDYITGQPFSFVVNLDALGAWLQSFPHGYQASYSGKRPTYGVRPVRAF